MSICEIFPNDPSCAVEEPEVIAPVDEPTDVVEDGEEVVEEGDAEEGAAEEEDAEPEMKVDNSAAASKAVADWTAVKDMSRMAMMDGPLMVNLAYFSVAASWAVDGALSAFRYRSFTDFYKNAKIGDGTNYWELSDMLRNYGGLAIGGVLSITSLMAAFGIAVPINGQAWMWLGLAGWVLDIVIAVIRFIGYDAGYSASEKKATAAEITEAAQGEYAMGVLEVDSLYDAAMGVSSMFVLAKNAEGWYNQQWNAMTDEEQMTKIGAWEEAVATKATEVSDAREAAGLMEGEAAEEAEEEVVECEEDDEECAAAAAAEEGDAEEGAEEEATEEADAEE